LTATQKPSVSGASGRQMFLQSSSTQVLAADVLVAARRGALGLSYVAEDSRGGGGETPRVPAIDNVMEGNIVKTRTGTR